MVTQSHTQVADLAEHVPLLLAFRDLVGLEPVLRDVQSAWVIVRMVWPAPHAVHDLLWPQKGELVGSSGCIPLCVTVLNGFPTPTFTAVTIVWPDPGLTCRHSLEIHAKAADLLLHDMCFSSTCIEQLTSLALGQELVCLRGRAHCFKNACCRLALSRMTAH